MERDLTRLQTIFEKANRGETLTIGFIGGSITQGCHSSKPEYAYAYRVYEWLQQKFPDADLTYVNAGIGGTTSHFGTARVKEDLLVYQPDLVFLDFTVNDDATDFFEETYEGVARQILLSEKAPALVPVCHIYYQNGMNAERVHAKICRHYKLPVVSMRPLYQRLLDGELEMNEITTDGLHPNDYGHKLVADLIIEKLEVYMVEAEENRKKDVCGENMTAVSEKIAAPLTANQYEHAVRYNNLSCLPQMEGFESDTRIPADITDCFAKGWTAKENGARITFSAECTELAIQYRRSLKKAPKAKVILDGVETELVLDGTFDETWGDQLALKPVLIHGQKAVHTMTLALQDCENAETDFMVVSFLLSR